MIKNRGLICKALFEMYQLEVYQRSQVQVKEKVLIPNISESQIYDDDYDEHNSTMHHKLEIVHAQVQELDCSQSSNKHKTAMANFDYIYKWGHDVYKNHYSSLVNKVADRKWFGGTFSSEEG